MKRRRYPSIALLMVAVYSLIALSPIAPAALRSPAIARAVTGACSGDCDICGCSPERRGSRTCCCWMKKKREEERRQRQTLLCHESEQPACCDGSSEDGGGGHLEGDTGQSETNATQLRCTPCSGIPHFTLTGAGEYHHLPQRFTASLYLPPGLKLTVFRTGSPSILYREPPNPPPKFRLPS